eukprot:519650-Pelagomonas_calceolata.AAC.2
MVAAEALDDAYATSCVTILIRLISRKENGLGRSRASFITGRPSLARSLSLSLGYRPARIVKSSGLDGSARLNMEIKEKAETGNSCNFCWQSLPRWQGLMHAVFNFHGNNKLILFVSELMDIMLAGEVTGRSTEQSG